MLGDAFVGEVNLRVSSWVVSEEEQEANLAYLLLLHLVLFIT
jgi:hypothetical protein